MPVTPSFYVYPLIWNPHKIKPAKETATYSHATGRRTQRPDLTMKTRSWRSLAVDPAQVAVPANRDDVGE